MRCSDLDHNITTNKYITAKTTLNFWTVPETEEVVLVLCYSEMSLDSCFVANRENIKAHDDDL